MQGTGLTNNTDNYSIERLWCTWSDIGLEGILRGGYQIRVVSPDLREVNNEQVIRLQPYFNYDLPLNTTRARLWAADAPISLSFVHNGWERILIHKVYKDKDRSDSK